MKKIFISLIALMSIVYINFAQDFYSYRLKFDKISIKDGLSQSTVNDIIQDYRGFMWFATLDGLNKFDGYNFTIYSNYGNNKISDNIINCLFETKDEKKQLWIGTNNGGLNLYDRIRDTFKIIDTTNSDLVSNRINALEGDSKVLFIGTDKGLNIFYQSFNKFKLIDTSKGLSANFINKLYRDDYGNLWIATNNGLNYFDTSLKKIFVFTTADGLPSNEITDIKQDLYGNLWIGTKNGLAYFRVKEKKFDVFTTNDGLSENYITTLLIDYQGIIWIGTHSKGLNRLDPVSKKISVYRSDPTDNQSLSVDKILSLYEDDAHIIWIGTSLGGINKWNRAAEELLLFRHNPYDEKSLSSNQVRSFYEDRQKTIWVGTVSGGLNKWNTKTHKFTHYKHFDNCNLCLSGNHIRSIFEDSLNNFWIGTAENGLNLFDRKTGRVIKVFKKSNSALTSNNIWKITQDKNNKLWIATYGGGINILDLKTFEFQKITTKTKPAISSNFVTNIFIDSQNRVWIATMDGLNLLINDKIKVFKHSQKPNSISDNRIYIIAEASDGTIWIGTKGGLNKYLGEDNFKSYTIENSDIPNNVILGILEDKNHNLWITTNRGLTKFNPQKETFKNYDINDGLQSNEFLLGAYFKTSDGMFLIGGINGFNAFYPEKIKDNPHIPSIIITDFMVSNASIKLDSAISEKKMIVLNHKQRDLTFKFVALDYILPEKNQYAYKLEGYDKDWIYCKYTREAKYTNLPPGKYIFRVKGSNNDQIWNEQGASLVVIIKPAFWQTKIFKISAVLFLIFSIGFGIRLRIRILKKRQEELEREVERQTRQIRKQKEEIERKNEILEKQKEEILKQNRILEQQKEEILAQRDEIELQKEIAEKQRDRIAQQKKDIEDSIMYARKIQQAVLPEFSLLDSLFDDYFVLYKPRDIVSGDFYWVGKKNDKIIAVAADCTGHGVPGAFMSMLGVSFLTKIIIDKATTEADKILNRLRDNIIKALHQNVDGDEPKDGMDISLVVIDYKNKTLEFAGANNPLYLVRGDQLIEYKADKMPIGIYDIIKPFSKKIIAFEKGDKIYMFSDGYADQFGGPKAKKFKYSRLKKLLLSVRDLPMEQQKEVLENTFEKWINYFDPLSNKDKFEQIDDILIFGIRL